MSVAKVEEILSHVDMTKIDLSSFKLSEKKYNELAHLYRNRVILSCISMITNKEKFTQEDIDHAYQAIKKIAANPDIYTYDNVYAAERKDVDSAINDITTMRNRSVNDVKIKAIEKRMKDTYKAMRKTIELAIANGNSFEYEFNEEMVERGLRITQSAIEDGEKKYATNHDAEVATIDDAPQKDQGDHVDAKEQDDQTTPEVVTNTNSTNNVKIPFWKRLFGKKAKT